MDPKVFGRYQIVRKLAGGGMGRVFLAYDPMLNRQVGLKLIDSDADRDSIDVVAAERRGASLQDQLAKRDTGGRVAQIFDVGDRDGYFYIAMEYIEGEDLSELVARGPLDPQRAVGIALDVLDVLVKAHNFQSVIDERTHRGIIHGDIKPRNIRITAAGHVKVLDFGIAKAVSMTRSITFNQFGSVPYSSPERLQTGDMDARSDVWSVAIVLFEMLTGKPYFEAEASSKLEWMIRNYRTLQSSIATLPPGLREILARALDPDLNKRFASAAAFRAALDDWRTAAMLLTDPANAPTGDIDATRRTAYADPDERTRRVGVAEGRMPGTLTGTPPRKTASLAQSKPWRMVRSVFHIAVPVTVALFLIAVFTIVYEIRIYNFASGLKAQLDSGRVSPESADVAYQDLAKKTWIPMPLWPVRRSLRDRFEAEADRVIADYREESVSTPVYLRDWRRAQTALISALTLSPEDKSIRGKQALVDGYLQLQQKGGTLKQARADFEQARDLLRRSPDPHLGLALIHMREGDLDQAEAELNEAKRTGFQPGRREQRDLANGYKARGEKWLAEANKAHDIGQMQDLLKHGVSDLAHAEELYNSVAPLFNGVQLAEKVSLERDKAAETLANAERIQSGQPASPPKENQ
jgi:eukaryotic-like serine/threonine-protein kinase